MKSELILKKGHELRALLDSGEVSSVEVTQAFLDRIDAVDGKINAFLTVTADLALEQAAAADKRIKEGHASPLTGIPVGLKDLLVTKGVRTTCASKILENFIPPYDGTVVAKLREAGAVFTGKLNMDEFAMGSSNENSAFGAVKNPWDLDRVPGGSSGGSAASVAALEVPIALGSDTGGSIREPASFCGIVGVKPTYGRVSRYGLIAFASSLDQIGPMTRDVKDAALVLDGICGHDPKDSTSVLKESTDFAGALSSGIRGVRIGVPKEYFVEGLDPEIERAVKGAISKLEELGAEVKEVSLPHTEYAVAVYYLLATAEASSNLARFDSVRYTTRVDGSDLIDTYKKTRAAGFGEEVKRRIMLGTYALSAGYYDAYYRRAQRVRTLIARDFDEAFKEVDVICSPTVASVAFKHGDKTSDPLEMYLSDIFTIPLNLAGLPGLSMPCGFSSDGMPIGLQMMAGPFREEVLLKTAYAFEEATDFSRVPGL
ncbi:MAG: Asp-tRNA(Asn)/Glu-tRNA(Gln) amidotransferase GatCAB subunit A [Deltaproteobacteria bacterium]|nr:MAG: Asp-tRNA(Asn)/Glu-tRNA(Gln) amidotransferase GatCAB subunit A [Deltaproteobacteria bacterium]